MDRKPKLLIGGEFRAGAAPRRSRSSIRARKRCCGSSRPATRPTSRKRSVTHRPRRRNGRRSMAGSAARSCARSPREMRARADDIARALSLEIGRPIAQAGGEVQAATEQFEWFAGEAERLFGDTIASRQGGRLITEYEPVGIAASFTAWNFPVNLPVRKIAPALAAGCAIIVRPSEQVPMTTTLIAEACVAGGVPAGVVQLLLGPAGRHHAGHHGGAGSAQDFADGLDARRADVDGGGGQDGEALLDGTRRARAGGGLRRCRHRGGGDPVRGVRRSRRLPPAISAGSARSRLSNASRRRLRHGRPQAGSRPFLQLVRHDGPSTA